MANKLKKMRLKSVDMTRKGANQKADIMLYKSADAQTDTGAPTESEKNLFKRFLNWMSNNPTEPAQGSQTPVGRSNEDPAEVYKSAITESLQSIVADDSLDDDEKKSLIEQSIGEYHDKMIELYSEPPVVDEPPTVTKSAPDIVEIEEITVKKK